MFGITDYPLASETRVVAPSDARLVLPLRFYTYVGTYLNPWQELSDLSGRCSLASDLASSSRDKRVLASREPKTMCTLASPPLLVCPKI